MAEAAKKKVPAKTTTAKPKTTAKTAAKTTAAKKPAAKRPVAKKPVTRKAPVKRAAAKKKPSVKPAAKTAAAADETVTQTTSEAPKATADKAKESHHFGSDEHSFNSDKLIAELKDKDWGTIAARAFFMVFFGFLANLALMATFLLALLQFVLMVGSGKPNDSITSIISRLATYIGQALNFLSFKTEDKPFPLDLDLPAEE